MPRRGRSAWPPAHVLLGALLLGSATSAWGDASIHWSVSHQALTERGNSLNVGDTVQPIRLNGGWSCSIGATSKQLPSYEARQTTCSNGDKSFRFSVQCERGRPKDHTQIRFTSPQGQLVDFIEVGCEFRE